MNRFGSALDKEMRSWDTYISLEGTVKNMLTSLKAVGELQNSAIRERHWMQLMKSTKVSGGGSMSQVSLGLACFWKCSKMDFFFRSIIKNIS